jgi:hypothetical protein
VCIVPYIKNSNNYFCLTKRASHNMVSIFEAQNDDFFIEPIDIEDDQFKLDYDVDEESDQGLDEVNDDDIANIQQFKLLTKEIRNYSFANFLTRSERNHLLGLDKAPEPEEAQRRSVKFRDESRLSVVHTIPRVEDEDKELVWFNSRDFSRFDTDTKVTIFRWENHITGKIKFDYDQNSIRGLENIINQQSRKKQPTGGARDDSTSKWTHIRNVISEVNRQKIEEGRTDKTLDWEKLRDVAQRVSVHTSKVALERGASDEFERKKATGEITVEDENVVVTTKLNNQTTDSPVTRKNPLKFFFSRKNGR